MRMKVSKAELIKRIDIRISEHEATIERLETEMQQADWREELRQQLDHLADTVGDLDRNQAYEELVNVQRKFGRRDDKQDKVRRLKYAILSLKETKALVSIAEGDAFSINTTDRDMMFIVSAGQALDAPEDEDDD